MYVKSALFFSLVSPGVLSKSCAYHGSLCPEDRRFYLFLQVPNAVTPTVDQDPTDDKQPVEVNIQLPDGPPPVQAPHPFQVSRSFPCARVLGVVLENSRLYIRGIRDGHFCGRDDAS